MMQVRVFMDFYDADGLLLNAGAYAPIEQEMRVSKLNDIVTAAENALAMMGALVPCAKSAGVYAQVPGKRHLIALDTIGNPHFDEKAAS